MLKLLLNLFSLSFNAAFSQDFVAVKGKQLCSWKFANINIQKVLKWELQLSIKERIWAETIKYDVAVVHQDVDYFLNHLRVVQHCLYCNILSVCLSFYTIEQSFATLW